MLTVYGIATSQDLVSALLEDPLSDDVERRRCIRDRWKDSENKTTSLSFECALYLFHVGRKLK